MYCLCFKAFKNIYICHGSPVCKFWIPKLCAGSSKFCQPLLVLKFDGKKQKNVMKGGKQEGGKACLREGKLER